MALIDYFGLKSEEEEKQRIKEIIEQIRSEPFFNDREDIHFIKVVRTDYEEIEACRKRGIPFDQLRIVLEALEKLPRNSKTASLRQAYYRETQRRKAQIEEGLDPAPWSKHKNED